MRRVCSVLLAVVLVAGCATTPPPYTGQGPNPQLERGAVIPPIDFLGNLLALPYKALLLNWRFDNHVISVETEHMVFNYIEARDLAFLHDTKFRLNQYAPFADLGRLFKNRHIAWPYRVLLGLPATLLTDVLLPGRIFPWGDYYNPFTNTVHLYSDEPAIALHEAGHAYDFSSRRFKGTYGALRLIPFLNLAQEWIATDEAIQYLQEIKDTQTELRAYKVLYPAYGSYIGGYIYAPIGTVIGVLAGHAIGQRKAADRKEYLERFDPPNTGP